MKRILIVFTLVVFCIQAFGQNGTIRQVRMGKIGISIYYQDTLLTVGSNSVRLIIDDAETKMTIRLDPSTLKTGIDSLDKKLRSRIHQDVVFNGEIVTQEPWIGGDRPESFEIEGDLTIEGVTNQVNIFAKLRKGKQGMGVDGILYLHFDPELADFELDTMLSGFAEFGCVEILQPMVIESDRH